MQVQGTRLYRVRDVAEHFDVSVSDDLSGD